MAFYGGIQGTPWHVDRYHREEGDDRRHSHRCKYFQKEKRMCRFKNDSCIGAAHCDLYEEIKKNDEPKQSSVVENLNFKGVKELPISSISRLLTNELLNSEAVKKLVAESKKRKSFPYSVAVYVKDGRYHLCGAEVIMATAIKLGRLSVNAEICSAEEIEERNSLRQVGSLVWSNKKKEVGQVVRADSKYTVIKFDDGEETKFDIVFALEKKNIRPM